MIGCGARQVDARVRSLKLPRDFVIHRANGDTVRGQIAVTKMIRGIPGEVLHENQAASDLTELRGLL